MNRRGTVWEQTMIMLPNDIPLSCCRPLEKGYFYELD